MLFAQSHLGRGTIDRFVFINTAGSFAGPHERIELVHKAQDRLIFARGAVKAALWAKSRKPGLYSMADVLGLSDM